MCGITGIAVFRGAPPAPELLQKMCGTIAHRGPDDESVDVSGQVGLGMRRLSIIDIAGGRQPLFNEDRSVRVVFNGEIYNYRELRQVLEKKGHHFASRSDTEVIVHAYEEYGRNFPEHLNGMFAIALHDMKRGKLFLARDHIGIKPLYLAATQTHLIFGSEIKTILASGLLRQTLDVDGLSQFMAWEYVPGNQTLFTAIKKLRPAEIVEVDLHNGAQHASFFWDVPDHGEENFRSEAEWREMVDTKVRDCVQRQLVSDVPLGAFLSGGVDSSLLVAAMGKVSTFSIGFDDPSYNELKWARLAADHLGVSHIDEIIRPDIVGLFDQLMYYLDDPIGDFSIFPTYLVSRLARKHVTVSLSGDGGDELFGGYESYVAQIMAQRYAKIPEVVRKSCLEPLLRILPPRPAKKGLINKAKRFAEGLEHPEMLAHARWRLFLGESLKHRLFTPEALAQIKNPTESHIFDLLQTSRNRQPINQCLYVDLKSYLCDNILTKVDRMSMAVSLEARVPYLDTELVELAFRMPDRWKVHAGETKTLLKKVAAAHLPHACIYRSKEGFSIPIKNWLGTTLRPLMEDLLAPRALAAEGIFQSSTVETMKKEHLTGRANHSHTLWSLMVFSAWRRRWLEA